MSILTETELKKIILDRLYYWIKRISGKKITFKKAKEAEEIADQVIISRKNKRICLL